MKESIFSIVGGLGIFLFGLRILTDGLRESSSRGIKTILHKLTSSPISGAAIGVVVTGILQSSSATTVLTVGFVNAGLITFKQAIGIILGANIGTTVTAQLMAFKISSLALPIIAVGAVLHLFVPNDTVKYVGSFLLGFGMVFYGMYLMKDGVKPLRESEQVWSVFRSLSRSPILGVLAGMVITMVIQSSSATVGIVLALLGAGLIDLDGAIPLILGDNIGTCVTAGIASIGTNLSARRTAVAHFGFNILGTLLVLLLLPFYKKLVLLTSPDVIRQAANAHTIFNVFNAMIFLPFTGLYAKLITRIIPGEVVIKEDRAIHLSKSFISTPPIALEAIDKEMARALSFSTESLEIVKRAVGERKYKNLAVLKENESITDNLQVDITKYCVELTRQPLSEIDAMRVPKLLHSINDIERIGDHGESLYNILRKMKTRKIKFSRESRADLVKMVEAVDAFVRWVVDAIDSPATSDLQKAFNYEKKLDRMRERYQDSFSKLLKNSPELALDGMVYNDLLANLERISDYLLNVAIAYHSIRQGVFQTDTAEIGMDEDRD